MRAFVRSIDYERSSETRSSITRGQIRECEFAGQRDRHTLGGLKGAAAISPIIGLLPQNLDQCEKWWIIKLQYQRLKKVSNTLDDKQPSMIILCGLVGAQSRAIPWVAPCW